MRDWGPDSQKHKGQWFGNRGGVNRMQSLSCIRHPVSKMVCMRHRVNAAADARQGYTCSMTNRTLSFKKASCENYEEGQAVGEGAMWIMSSIHRCSVEIL